MPAPFDPFVGVDVPARVVLREPVELRHREVVARARHVLIVAGLVNEDRYVAQIGEDSVRDAGDRRRRARARASRRTGERREPRKEVGMDRPEAAQKYLDAQVKKVKVVTMPEVVTVAADPAAAPATK